MNKPINVLTGLDYWLDNLMCKFPRLWLLKVFFLILLFYFLGNVPEVVMCYHLGKHYFIIDLKFERPLNCSD